MRGEIRKMHISDSKNISVYEMTMALSNAMDLISPKVVSHHMQVAYIAHSIGEVMGLEEDLKNELVLSGALHDSGAFTLKERLDALEFELKDPFKHSEAGYYLLSNFRHFKKIAQLVRFHHVPWEDGRGMEFRGKDVPIESHILHLSDRISVSINKEKDIFDQRKEIIQLIKSKEGLMFNPVLVEAFEEVALKESFWLDVTSQNIDRILMNRIKNPSDIKLDDEGLKDFAKLFCQIIDFRSRFTSTHSAGVAACGKALAEFYGMNIEDVFRIEIAGYFHDLGKLAVPITILEKPGRLNNYEINIMKTHTYYTYRTLERIKGFEKINQYASYHHEKLDGTGYPFHLKADELNIGSRIIAVSDIFTALTEDRPYRKGILSKDALKLIKEMSYGKLDQEIISILNIHYDVLNSIRIVAQEISQHEFNEFKRVTQ